MGLSSGCQSTRSKERPGMNDIQVIDGLVKVLGERYDFTVMPAGKTIDNYDKGVWDSSTFVLCQAVTGNKSHKNWRRTKFSLYYVNTFCYIDETKQDKDPIVEGGIKTIVENVTPLKLRRLLENFKTLAEIEAMEEETYRRFD